MASDLSTIKQSLEAHLAQHSKGSRPKIHRFVEALFSGTHTRRDLMKAANISQPTYYRWLHMTESHLGIQFDRKDTFNAPLNPLAALPGHSGLDPADLPPESESVHKILETRLDPDAPATLDEAQSKLKSALSRDDAIRYLDRAIQQTTTDPKLRAQLIEQRAKLSPDWRQSGEVQELDPLKVIGKDGLLGLEAALLARLDALLPHLHRFPALLQRLASVAFQVSEAPPDSTLSPPSSPEPDHALGQPADNLDSAVAKSDENRPLSQPDLPDSDKMAKVGINDPNVLPGHVGDDTLRAIKGNGSNFE